LPSLGASQQQVWLNSGKRSQSYRGVKIERIHEEIINEALKIRVAKSPMDTIEKYHVFFVFSRPGTGAANSWLYDNHLWIGNSILEAQLHS